MAPAAQKPPRVLPPHVFDALQLSAEMYGGIGSADFVVSGNALAENPEAEVPNCYVGHLWCAGLSKGKYPCFAEPKYDITWTENDRAVNAIRARKGIPYRGRVSFEDWCAEMNVVRGEEAAVRSERSELPPDTSAGTPKHRLLKDLLASQASRMEIVEKELAR